MWMLCVSKEYIKPLHFTFAYKVANLKYDYINCIINNFTAKLTHLLQELTYLQLEYWFILQTQDVLCAITISQTIKRSPVYHFKRFTALQAAAQAPIFNASLITSLKKASRHRGTCSRKTALHARGHYLKAEGYNWAFSIGSLLFTKRDGF